MQRLTFPIEPDGLRVPAMLGPEAAVMQAKLTQGIPLPLPLHVRAMLDTGTTVTAVAPTILSGLNAVAGGSAPTQTASGSAPVSFYKVSFTIYNPTAGPGTDLTRGTWLVTNLPQDLPDVDVLFGMDLIREIRLAVDGPAGTFTIEFDP